MVLASEDSKLIYPDNKPYDFRVHLSTPISLTGYWTVSLLEICIETGQAFKYPTTELFVFFFFQICAIIQFLADTTFHCFVVFG